MFTFWALADMGKQSAAAPSTAAKALAGNARFAVLKVDFIFSPNRLSQVTDRTARATLFD
jgi:hypothetical protein